MQLTNIPGTMNLTLRVWPDIVTKPLIFEFSALTNEHLSATLTISFINVVLKKKKTGKRYKIFHNSQILASPWPAVGSTCNLWLKFQVILYILCQLINDRVKIIRELGLVVIQNAKMMFSVYYIFPSSISYFKQIFLPLHCCFASM